MFLGGDKNSNPSGDEKILAAAASPWEVGTVNFETQHSQDMPAFEAFAFCFALQLWMWLVPV